MNDNSDPFQTPYRFVSPDAPALTPFDADEIFAAALRPHRAIDLVLVDRARFALTVAEGRNLPALCVVLLFASVLFTLPYGAVLGLENLWRIALLYLGSVAICFPSLHVFSGYLGCRMRLGQNMVIALVISAVAGMFVLGFAPILWFVDLTTTTGSIATTTVSVLLLAGALLAGLGHVARTLIQDQTAAPDRSYQFLMVAWQGLLVFVAYRMGDFLGARMTTLERCLKLLVAPALYGFSIGAVRSWRLALLNVVKFPLLIYVSILVCAGAYYLVARFFAPSLTFSDVRRLVVSGYADIAALLASLSVVCLFCALTFEQPTSLLDLGEYPLFLGLNVLLIAACGALTLARQALALLRRHGLSRSRASMLVASWLLLSLTVGGQCAWYLRPFFGNGAIADDGSFCLGERPDFRGAESFYEAVYHLVDPPRTAPQP